MQTVVAAGLTMPRTKQRRIRSIIAKRRQTTRLGRMPEPVQPTPEALLRRAEALGINISLTVDTDSGRLVWDNSVDLTAAVDALAIYRGAGVIRGRHERAGRLYAMGRRATFGAVFPISTVLAPMVASSPH